MYSSKISGLGRYVPDKIVTNDDLSKTGFGITGTSAISSFTVAYGVAAFDTGPFAIEGSIGGADSFIHTTETGVRTGGGFVKFGAQSVSVPSLVTLLSPATARIIDIDCYINGSSSAITDSTDNDLNLGGTTDIFIGGTSSANFDGIVQEVIIYDSDQSANRTGIEGNINDYYNIYS